jgi:hydroxylaminobenzene mutase
MSVQKRAQQILVLSLSMVMFGLVWGLVVPNTPYPRLALTAHIQFLTNGTLLIVMAVLLLALPHNVGSRSASIMLLATCLTWLMALSEVANAWWGTSEILSIAAKQAGAGGAVAWQETVLKLTHISAGLGLIVAWALLIAGFVRTPVPSE